ncbi:Uncharacterised protein [Mycobacteroides abscessus subsp. abscessus]|nr:Uncharacterised protein [Mycobacteroides abscessus subsp. abscessus]
MLAADICLGGVVGAEIHQGNRLLWIEAPVQNADKGFHNKLDDHRAARRAESQEQRAALAGLGAFENQGGRHRATGTFSWLQSVGDREPVLTHRLGGEVGELVVEKEPVHHVE